LLLILPDGAVYVLHGTEFFVKKKINLKIFCIITEQKEEAHGLRPPAISFVLFIEAQTDNLVLFA
jgi:hypothetical protein